MNEEVLLRCLQARVPGLIAARGDRPTADDLAAFSEGLEVLGVKVDVEALNSVDRNTPRDAADGPLMDYMGRTADAPPEVLRGLTAADVQAQVRRLFRRAQLAALRRQPRVRWWLMATPDACPVCAALARAQVDDLDVLAHAWADDDCGAVVAVDRSTVDRVSVQVGGLRVDNVPVDCTRAVTNFVGGLLARHGGLLRTEARVELCTDPVDVYAGPADAPRLIRTAGGSLRVRWDASWRTTLASALVDDAKLPSAALAAAHDRLAAGGCMDAGGVLRPSMVIYPSARRDVAAYAHACAVAHLVDDARLAAVDPAAWAALSEEGGVHHGR